MALIEESYGCKVGWAVYDNEAEAQTRAESAKHDAHRRVAQGYDFGYCVPGSITHSAKHPDGERWIVTLP